jgi:hypothetical protein
MSSSVLKTFSKLLEELPSVDISNDTIARQFVFATDGRLRDICRLLVRSVQLAGKESSPGITINILAQAFRDVIFPDAPNERNPFHKSFNGIPLTRPDEPFAPREE